MLVLRIDSIYDSALYFLRNHGRSIRTLYGLDASLHLGYLLILSMYLHWSFLRHERLYNNKLWIVWSLDSASDGCL